MTGLKKILFILFLVCPFIGIKAQKEAGTSTRTTVYEEYKPAKITLYNGKVIFQKEANIFLKDATLLFKNGKLDMKANMRTIQSVEFADRFYVKLDTLLAMVVDTLGGNRVLCATTVDMEAYAINELNNQVVSNLNFGGDQVSVARMETTAPEDRIYPLINTYYFEIKGKIIKAHERTINRYLSKEKRNRLKFYMGMPEFDWGDRRTLRQVLELFEE